MPNKNAKKVKNSEFVIRFIEVCGSSQAADIRQLLGISYQTVKNYLEGGRLPDTIVLMAIAGRTNYSIH